MYQGHQKVLDKFEAFTKKHDLLEKICVKMYKVGRYVYCCISWQDANYFTCHRFHSGADPLTNMSSSVVSTNAFTVAMKEYEDGDMDVDDDDDDDDEEEEEDAGGKEGKQHDGVEGEQQGGVEGEQQDGVEGEQEGDVEGEQEDGLEREQKDGAEGDEGGEEGEEEEQELEEEEEDE